MNFLSTLTASILLAATGLAACHQRPNQQPQSDVGGPASDVPPPVKCTAAWTAAQCAAANESLARDARDLAADMAGQDQDRRAQRDAGAAPTPDPAAVDSSECKDQQISLQALRRTQHPAAGEVITPEEAQSLPADIAKVERYLEQHCQ